MLFVLTNDHILASKFYMAVANMYIPILKCDVESDIRLRLHVIFRFGSWIYSGLWMDYVTMYNDRSVVLSTYVNNSEWDLLSVVLNKSTRTHSCCTDPHPDLTYTLHVRRKTFYYIFNIIVPCVMLSILTLLTFWLPPTSGEKITLGLSVFLAFSMFMLLIAEEVPATSEAVPLIGILSSFLSFFVILFLSPFLSLFFLSFYFFSFALFIIKCTIRKFPVSHGNLKQTKR